MEITTYRLSGQHGARRRAEAAFPEALNLVQRFTSGSMPRTRLVLTTLDGVQEMGRESMGRAAGVPRSQWPAAGTLHGNSREPLYACTVLSPVGVDILISLRETGDDLAGVLLHEPVHALQLNRSGARAEEIQRLQATFGMTTLSGRDLRRSERQMEKDEREAQRIERRLLPQFTV